MIIALDIATAVGWASGRPGDEPEWGARNFAGKGGTGEVVAKFRAWINERCYTLKPTLVVFESPYVPVPRAARFVRAGTDPASAPPGPPPMNPLVLRRLLGMIATVEAVCFELRIPCAESTSAEITKFFTGRARWGSREAKKAETIRVCSIYGWTTVSDDAADALALWHLAEFKVSPEIASRRRAGAGAELALHGTLDAPTQARIGRRVLS